MLKAENIRKSFNVGSVDEKNLFTNFSLEVKEGEFTAVVGSNGSGKTTILNIIAGDMPIDGGKIILDGEDITHKKNYKRSEKIARVFQDPAIGTCPSMTIFENMSVADNKLKPFNLTKGLNKARKEFYQTQLEVLGLGLENRMNTLCSSLSGGQRQALALVMATLVTPKLLLLDEHTAALDPKSSDIVMQLTKRVIETKKITTLMVTHNLRYAVDYGTRTIMMHEGKIVYDASGEKRENQSTDDLLKLFNEISIECGN